MRKKYLPSQRDITFNGKWSAKEVAEFYLSASYNNRIWADGMQPDRMNMIFNEILKVRNITTYWINKINQWKTDHGYV